MSSYKELFSETYSDETLPIENITNAFVTLLYRVSQVKQSIPQCSGSNNTTGSNSGSSNFNNDYPLTCNQVDKLREDLNHIRVAFHNLNQFVNSPIKNFEHNLNDIFSTLGDAPSSSVMTKQVRAKLSALENHAMKLRFHIPSMPTNMSSTGSDVHRYTWKKQSNSVVDEKFPILHMNHKFLHSSVFTELQEAFEELPIKLKHCLLCFAVVPENEVVKRRLLIDWWVGECLVDSSATEEKMAEKLADEILKELMAKDFIEPVKQRNKRVTNRFKMQPRVRCVVIMLAQDSGFFDYDFNGNPTANSSQCYRLCLLKAEDGASEQVLSSSPEKVQTVFNVNEPFPDLRLESFSKMNNVNVLYLGRWQSSCEHHIEVESIDFLKVLKNMKCLRLLSLQGISRINELPNSVGKLTNLRILDLKACHNLEALPDGIALLKQLTHLDISDCYLLDGMPKGLVHLSKLEVLKGFLIGNLKSGSSCTLEDLTRMEKLSKLSINTSSKAFPTEEELHALGKLESLRKLGIAWGMKQENGVPNSVGTVNSDNRRRDNRRQDSGAAKLTRAQSVLDELQMGDPETLEFPTKLEKLKLQCLPHRETPWLIPGKLKSLKKLYIRGGELENLGQMEEGNDKWTIEILHLKYLDAFKMGWEELHNSFPNLIFLESVECRNLTTYPCDEHGVWLKHEQCPQ